MAYQTTFERYEIKYLLTAQQKEQLLRAMRGHMQLDQFGRSTIRNIYYDTDTFRLIRRSLEKPAYKEKLRIRSYQRVEPNDPVFVELKKKFQSVVYKRRLVLPEEQAMTSFRTGDALPVQSQIADEIEYFRAYYRTLRPAVFCPMSARRSMRSTAATSASPLMKTSCTAAATFRLAARFTVSLC